MTSSILPGADLNIAGSPTPSAAQRIASYTDVGKYVIGREYLGKWYNLWRATPGAFPQIVVRGDSTVEGGTNISDFAYRPTNLLTVFARSKGFTITAVNGGVPGTTTLDWLNTHLPSDLATYTGGNIPPLYIVHYGMNDPRSNAANMSPAQTVQALKDGLALLRGTWSAQQTSVMVVLPNTAAWDAVGVNEAWREGINYQLAQVCRDYGVACFDTYAWAREARYGLLTGWLDSPAVHPNEDFNSLIWGAVADVLFPPGLCAMHGAPVAINPMSGYTNPGLASGGAMTTMVGNHVFAIGYLAKTTPGTIASGTEIARLTAAGMDPIYSRVYGVTLGAFDGTNWEYIHAEVRSLQGGNLGSILLRQAVTLTATQIHFSGGWVR